MTDAIPTDGAETASTADTGDTIEATVHPGWADPDPAELASGLYDRGSRSEGGAVPEAYALNLPAEYEGRVALSADHPLYAPAADWARKWDLPQQAFDELVGIQAGYEAGAGIDADAERAKMLDAFSEGGRLSETQAQARADEIGKWAVGLLGGDLKRNPALINELMLLTATADGVALLRTLKNRVGEARPPRAARGHGGDSAMSTEAFYRELFRSGGRS